MPFISLGGVLRMPRLPPGHSLSRGRSRPVNPATGGAGGAARPLCSGGKQGQQPGPGCAPVAFDGAAPSHCNGIIAIPASTGPVDVGGTPVLLLSCSYCLVLIGVVRA